MEKYFYDIENGLWYMLNGDYYIPCIEISMDEHLSIGVWGRRHLHYIKRHCPVRYADLVLSDKLYSYLVEIDTQARIRVDTLVKQLAEAQGVTEQLKAENQMAWVGAMNNIRNAAEEIVNAEVIFA